ncbi:DUF2163 domain-containing protein [Pseudomonas fluorescens]|uniref:DUF2163 domain-containing protein n=1 Tax=Pseudomonas fluorescens TaxID=294 RepID=UPI001BEA07AB|nr:DUF2163 domain-containing protein [Pseudomonas fluorescens]MBT2371928.1 DUF2163 domain-containing protein [Pseudomonas fluorescens]
MIAASPELTQFLATARSFVMADLYTIALASGQVLRYTDAGSQIYVDGLNYSASGPLIRRTGIRMVRGVEVDTLNVTFYAGLQDTLLGEPVLAFIAGGGFDGASLTLSRAFMPDWGEPVVGTITRFIGRVAEVDPADREQATFAVKSPMELLDTKVPKGVFQPGCLRTVYSADCGVNRALFETAGNVLANITSLSIQTDVAAGNGWFDQGVIRFVNGGNAGVSRTVRHQADDGTVSLILGLPAVPQPGDQFLIYPGCPRTLDACTNKFGNRGRYRGMPFIPVAETSV